MKITIVRRTRQPEERTFGERMAEQRAAENAIMGTAHATAHRKANADRERQYREINKRLRELAKRKGDFAAIEELEALLIRLRELAP